MLIVSKFHDYYDGALGVAGVDKSIVYERHLAEVDEKGVEKFTKMILDNPYIEYPSQMKIEARISNGYPVRQGVILFCGKMYFYVGIPIYKDTNVYADHYEYHYYPEYVDHVSVKASIAGNSRWNRKDKSKLDRYHDTAHHFKDMDVTSWHEELNTPIIHMSFFRKGCNGEINPDLQALNFYRVIPAFEAFQEVQHFIGNILTNREDGPPTESTEAQKLGSKGMDDMSFKRTEHPRKSRRK